MDARYECLGAFIERGPWTRLQDQPVYCRRGRTTKERLDDLNDVYRMFRCQIIVNCTEMYLKEFVPPAPSKNQDDDERLTLMEARRLLELIFEAAASFQSIT